MIKPGLKEEIVSEPDLFKKVSELNRINYLYYNEQCWQNFRWGNSRTVSVKSFNLYPESDINFGN